MLNDEDSLLLFLETCAVDCKGKIDHRKMNGIDLKIVEDWNKSGFVKYGRIPFDEIKNNYTHWVILSEEAWNIVHILRKDRAKRNLPKFE